MTQRPYSLGNRRTIAVALFAFVFGAPGMFDDGAVWWGLVGNVPGGRVLPIVVAGMGAFGLVLIGIAWLRPPPKLRGLEITSGAILTTPPNIVPTAVIAGLRIVSRGPETVVLSLDMAIHDVGGKKVERMLPRDETRSTFSAPLNLVDGMDGKVAALWLSSDRQPPLDRLYLHVYEHKTGARAFFRIPGNYPPGAELPPHLVRLDNGDFGEPASRETTADRLTASLRDGYDARDRVRHTSDRSVMADACEAFSDAALRAEAILRSEAPEYVADFQEAARAPWALQGKAEVLMLMDARLRVHSALVKTLRERGSSASPPARGS